MANREYDESLQMARPICSRQNEHERLLRGEQWNAVLHLLGKRGNAVMRSLLLDCGLFVPFSNSKGNLYQLSGRFTMLGWSRSV